MTDKAVADALTWADASLTQRWRIVRASMPDDPDPMTDSMGARFEAMHAGAMDTLAAEVRRLTAEAPAREEMAIRWARAYAELPLLCEDEMVADWLSYLTGLEVPHD